MGSCNSYHCQKEHEGKDVRIAELERQLAEVRAERDNYQTLAESKVKSVRDLTTDNLKAERDRLAAELERAKAEAGEAMLIVETQDQQIKGLAAEFERKVAVAKEALLECKKLNGMDRPISCSDVAEAALASLEDRA